MFQKTKPYFKWIRQIVYFFWFMHRWIQETMTLDMAEGRDLPYSEGRHGYEGLLST